MPTCRFLFDWDLATIVTPFGISGSSQMQGRLLGMSAFGFGIDLQGMGLHIRMAVVTEMSQITMDSYNRDDNGRYRLSL
jgi:hypothetical protein